MPVDERLGAERLDEIHLGEQRRLRLGARLEMLGADAEQHVRAVALRGDQVHRRRADETGDENARRPGIHLERRADLLRAAGVHDDHAVREGHGLDLVVRDEEAGGAQPAVQRLQLGAHLYAQLRVEVGERLVEEEHGGLADDGASHRHALALSAGELARLSLQIGLELEDPGRARDASVDVAFRQAADAQSVRHVLNHAHVRVERVVLEHHGDVAVLGLERVHHPAADRDLAGSDGL